MSMPPVNPARGSDVMRFGRLQQWTSVGLAASVLTAVPAAPWDTVVQQSASWSAIVLAGYLVLDRGIRVALSAKRGISISIRLGHTDAPGSDELAARRRPL
ncbi:hypothetical protein [Nocardia sp. NPDC051832]|uniref:hypothetical protein n=1 Tax=Nocardia sp. NPDC051832 TaxID=3155673 RepID=UPI00341627AF